MTEQFTMTKKNLAHLDLNYPKIAIYVDGTVQAFDDKGNIVEDFDLKAVLPALADIDNE